MYVSRLMFNTVPGKGPEACEQLKTLAHFINDKTGAQPRILRTHFCSLGEADLALEQDVSSLDELESQIKKVAQSPDFRSWSEGFSPLLSSSPKREVFEVLAS
jgi:hypothetical protein